MKYQWLRKPYKHQVRAVRKLLHNGWGGALLMEPRTGKTKVIVDYASILHLAGKVNRVLVICPLGVMGVWEDEIEANCPVSWRVFSMDRRARKREGWPTYTAKTKKPTLDWVVLNYDALSSPGRKTASNRRSRSRGGRFEVKREVMKWEPDLIVFDESHRIKSPTAKKSTMAHTLASFVPYRVIATGTAVTKKKRVFDVYSQWKVLNPERFSEYTFSDFKAKVGIWIDRNGYPQWVRNRAHELEWVRQEIHKDAYAVRRQDCFDLPPRRDQVIHVELDSSGPHYDEMAEEMVTHLKNGEVSSASIRLVQTLRLAQITSGLARTESSLEYPRGRLFRVGHEKLVVLESLLQDLFEADEKVVIAARFRADLSSIARLCKRELKVPIYPLWGGLSRSTARSNIRNFQTKDGPAAFIMQPQAGGLGIELGSASIMIWYSLTNSYVDFTQACDRIALSQRSTSFIYLLARQTVDEVMYQALQEDGDVVKRITQAPESLLRVDEQRT